MTIPLEEVVNGYMAALIWNDLDDEQLNYEFAPSAVEALEQLCQAFILEAGEETLEYYCELLGASYDHIGYDLYLTSKGHGEGFPKRDLGDLGKRLTKIAIKYCREWFVMTDHIHFYGQEDVVTAKKKTKEI